MTQVSSQDYRPLLGRWLLKKDIANRHGDVYLSRWSLQLPLGHALMLHCMRRPDGDRCLHDHPWWFLTLVLWGGYAEEVEDADVSPHGVGYQWLGRRVRWNRPGVLLHRPAMHTHRVAELPRGNCWTLVLRGPVKRDWGFRNEAGEWRHWRTFVDWAGSVLWCDERKGGKDR